LIASVIEGEINVRLQPEASAYIETGGAVISADKGASFRLRVEDQNAQVDASVGEVYVEPQQFYRYKLRPVERDPITGIVKSAPRTTYVPARESRKLSVSVRKRTKPKPVSTGFLPQADEPAKDLRIQFTLDDPTIGKLDPVETTTDATGVATTNFTSTSDRGKSNFTATVVENPVDKYVGKIVIGKPPGKFSLRNILIAAGVMGAVLIICCRPDPMKQDPPIVIEP
jgi:hypothetical protein